MDGRCGSVGVMVCGKVVGQCRFGFVGVMVCIEDVVSRGEECDGVCMATGGVLRSGGVRVVRTVECTKVQGVWFATTVN